MSDESTQKTPKGGAEILVPTREEWERILRKAAKPKPEGSTPSSPTKK